MVLLAEMYTIKACAVESVKMGYRYKNIYILSNSQAAIKAPDKRKICIKLAWGCSRSLMVLAERGRGHVMSEPASDQVAKMGSLHVFKGPEPTCVISDRLAGRAVRDCWCET